MTRLLLAALLITITALAACASSSTSDLLKPNQAKVDGPHPLAGKPVNLPAPPALGEVGMPRHPSISPDGATICFAWRGDLWKVSAQGGAASRLTSHRADDYTSVWSADGSQIAFNSLRSGYGNIHIMNADGSDVRQVTHEDRYLWLHQWIEDENGDRFAFASHFEADPHREPRPYTVSIDGGPIERIHDAYGRQPALSPDGRHVVFVRGGSSWDRPFITNSDNRDLWLYDTQTGGFAQLTDNLGNDGLPRWIDNDTIIYKSARPDNADAPRVNLFAIDLGAGEGRSRALTSFVEDDVRSFNVSRDGSTAVMQVWDKLYTLDLTDEEAQPVALTITAPSDVGDTEMLERVADNANEAALSPDGKTMAISAHGEIFIRTMDSENPAQRVTDHAAMDSTLAWSPDGVTLYFTSDRSGKLGIYAATVALTRTQIVEAVNPPEVVEEEEVEDEADEESIEEEPEETDEDADDEDADEEAEEEEEEEEVDPLSLPDAWQEAMRFNIEPVVVNEAHNTDASPSPDGKTLAYRRGNGNLMLLDLDAGEAREYLATWDTDMHWSWSPDSMYLAVSYEDQNHNGDIWIGPADASTEPVNITKHPAGDYLPTWSADSRIVSFVSFRNDDQGDVYAVYLDEALETYTAQQLEDYYEEAESAAKKIEPLAPQNEVAEAEDEGDADDDEEEEEEEDVAEPEFALALDDVYLRLRRLTTSSATEWNVQILPAGNQVFYTRGTTGYIRNWDGSDEEKVADNLDPQHLNLTGSQVVALQNDNAATINIAGGKVNAVAYPITLRIDRALANRQRFIEAARAISTQFYDDTYKGLDWENITARYAQLAEQAWTADEFEDLANQYIGLLDASHMGIRFPSDDQTDSNQANGRLGATYQRVAQGFEVIAIEPQTPAADGVMKLKLGDIITHINFEPLNANDTLPARLIGRVGQETAVTVLRKPIDEENENPQPAELHLLITPISYGLYTSLRYDNWQLANKARVDEWSGGRLGYIHIKSMDGASLADFERDLYAACEGREGLIVDVRDNGGGWTTDRLLASIMTRRHAYTVPRGADPSLTNSYPNDRLFIARYNLPMNCLCNEKSFSNAEIFSHAFKTLERGTLVGNTTAGGVISTGSSRLLDGTSIRIPFRGWYLTDGTDMENHGAVPHLMIPQTPEDEAENKDPQLQAAVDNLLEQLE